MQAPRPRHARAALVAGILQDLGWLASLILDRLRSLADGFHVAHLRRGPLAKLNMAESVPT
jgi:hypothetical protein